MAWKLRLVQTFEEAHREEFLALEKQFIRLEKETPDFPQGRRFVSFCGTLPNCTLIWECEFDTVEQLLAAKRRMQEDSGHEALFRRQVPFFLKSYTEIYESLEG